MSFKHSGNTICYSVTDNATQNSTGYTGKMTTKNSHNGQNTIIYQSKHNIRLNGF